MVALLLPESPGQRILADHLVAAAEGDTRVVVPFTCVGESWRTLTEPRGYGAPPEEVEFSLRRLLRSIPPVYPTPRAGRRWLTLASQARARGASTFDFQIAAICLEHGVDEIWTFDASFPVVETLRVVNPLA